MCDPIQILQDYFGYSSFRPGQKELVGGLLAGRDVLGILPTGAGKSICYQVPALAQDGVTLVISPLISLMKDQVASLIQSGKRAFSGARKDCTQLSSCANSLKYGRMQVRRNTSSSLPRRSFRCDT